MLTSTPSGPEPPLRFRFWGQYAHLVVPANRPDLIHKAVRDGTAPTARLMAAAGASAPDLAVALGVDEAAVRALLDAPKPSPVVVVDAEDGLPAGRMPAAFLDGVVEALSAALAQHDGSPLIAYRIPRVADGGVDHLREVLGRVAGTAVAPILDAVVIPKAEETDEVQAVADVVAEAERVGPLAAGRLRLLVQVESAAGLSVLPAIARLPAARLGGFILGAADLAADLGLPSNRLDQPVVHHARYELVKAAAIAGVPAIDGMTLAYPAVDATLAPGPKRAQWLDRMALVYADAVSALETGMTGKWVGHPAQLFATTLARVATLTAAILEAAADEIDRYREGLRVDQGVTLMGGQMVDRATARHAGGILRRATAYGLFDPRRAIELGVVTERELAE
jgi:citrate lyase subunit beta/citryl-CoA lyase